MDNELNQLKGEIVKYASLVESMITKSVNGLVNKSSGYLEEVINEDEEFANKKEILIDEECIAILAKYSPKALALRTILMIMKMNNDLERMADHCVNICRSAKELIQMPTFNDFDDIRKMSAIVKEMLMMSTEAFINNNKQMSLDICEIDSQVNHYRDIIIQEYTELMIKDSTIVRYSTQIMSVARDLERIADLTTNIAEDIIFMIEGKVIKHGADM